jgi:hypothetical protein
MTQVRNLPAVVIHADWSTDPKKRWLARAVLDGDVFHVEAPVPVGDVSSLFQRTARQAGSRPMVMGFDFPIGIPKAYALKGGVTSFLSVLPQLGTGRWRRFYEIAERAAEIAVERPFYPKNSTKKGETTRAQLVNGLGFTSMNDLLRRCEHAHADRGAACSLFWTLGGNQVGRAAIVGWRDFLGPLLRSTEPPISIWPFEGNCTTLLNIRPCVVVETYPADACVQLGLGAPGRRWSKRKQEGRRIHSQTLTKWAKDKSIVLHDALETAVQDGFGSGAEGEDAFDATVGLLAMLNVILGHRSDGTPNDESTQKFEGWIFGQSGHTPSRDDAPRPGSEARTGHRDRGDSPVPRTPVDVTQVPFDAIRRLREEYRLEMACQIVHDSWHARGFTNSYLCRVDGQVVGYGSVGGAPGERKDIAKEFFVLPERRGLALRLFRRLIVESGARTIEAQTNDRLLSLMLYDCAADILSETVLFADAVTTNHPAPSRVSLRRVTENDRGTVFHHTVEPVGDFGLEFEGQLVATGGILSHYNPPYSDIYMEVARGHQRAGYGSYLVQELKRICREMGRVPAARCQQENQASRLTLQRAGLFPCARILRGRVAS